MAQQQEFALQIFRPAGADEFEIKIFVRPVNLVANERESDFGKVNANLMRPTSARHGSNQAKLALVTAFKPSLNKKLSLCRGPGVNHTLLQPDR